MVFDIQMVMKEEIMRGRNCRRIPLSCPRRPFLHAAFFPSKVLDSIA